MCTKNQALTILREVFDSCIPVFGEALKEAFLYGSYARGDYHRESDVDILVLVDMLPCEISKCRNALAEITSRLSLEYDVTVSVTAKSYEQFAQFKGVVPFYKNVLEEGIKYAG